MKSIHWKNPGDLEGIGNKKLTRRGRARKGSAFLMSLCWRDQEIAPNFLPWLSISIRIFFILDYFHIWVYLIAQPLTFWRKYEKEFPEGVNVTGPRGFRFSRGSISFLFLNCSSLIKPTHLDCLAVINWKDGLCDAANTVLVLKSVSPGVHILPAPNGLRRGWR